MGSKATADRATMKSVLETLKEGDLYFLDSLTSSLTVTSEVANEVGIPHAINNLFIDNVNEEEAIKIQLRQGMELAKRRGQAIVIGHVRPQTVRALWGMISEIVETGISIVPVSQLLIFPDMAITAYEHVREEGPY